MLVKLKGKPGHYFRNPALPEPRIPELKLVVLLAARVDPQLDFGLVNYGNVCYELKDV